MLTRSLTFTGDTTITLLREQWKKIVPHYRWIIHEVTFLGTPSTDLDTQVMSKGHCHYAQVGLSLIIHSSVRLTAAGVGVFIATPVDLRLSKDELHFSPLESEVRKGRGP